ncbi:MAG: asparagine synthase (glutamine-hydrolyzing) [Saprospiraceae bacterium]|nr:asparagine synthase (glutamine-hydrolyzing) [Saprospiraceae bacterium]
MCGIIGTLTKIRVDQELIFKQLLCIRHRGPDDSGIFSNKELTIALGSVRLAIQDLSPLGKMPMHDDSNLVHIVLNGEIYNFQLIRKELISLGYSFRSNSDTEVILKGYLVYGIKVLDKLSGMFALAILDERTNQCFLARDRSGEKPLYYWSTEKQFSFGSELKVFLENPAFPKKVNKNALSEYLQYGYISSTHSIMEGVQQLQPAHYLEINTQTLEYQTTRYWAIPSYSAQETLTEKDYVSELEHLLKQSISQQLIADVPVGIFLSGGVDSSLITAIAAEISSQPINTFHISMTENSALDEKKYANQVATIFSTNHIELNAKEVTFDDFISIISLIDEPLADSSFIPTYIVSKLAKKQVTVAIGGDGGDELFGGYSHYSQVLKTTNFSIFSLIPYSILTALPNFRGKGFFLNQKEKNYENGFIWYIRREEINSVFSNKNSLLEPFFKKNKIEFSDKTVILNNITKFDFVNYLTDDLLVKVDRASMLNSLETRAPFLDKDLVEFAYSKVPSSLKVHKDGTTKYLVKKLLKGKYQRLI